MLRFGVVTIGCALLVAVGIALEVVLKISENKNGVSMPSQIPWSYSMVNRTTNP
jgi:hypothetical protein